LYSYEACYETWFTAGHYILSHPGSCSRPHGHNYRVVVCVESEGLNQLNMVIDYYELKSVVDGVVSALDHAMLNEVLATKNPTSEVLARHIYEEVSEKLKGYRVSRVTVCETPDFCVSLRQRRP